MLPELRATMHFLWENRRAWHERYMVELANDRNKSATDKEAERVRSATLMLQACTHHDSRDDPRKLLHRLCVKVRALKRSCQWQQARACSNITEAESDTACITLVADTGCRLSSCAAPIYSAQEDAAGTVPDQVPAGQVKMGLRWTAFHEKYKEHIMPQTRLSDAVVSR